MKFPYFVGISTTETHSTSKSYTFEYVASKFNQDLIDYKNRDLIMHETKDIRNILYVKAFANNDDFEDFNLASE